MKQINGVDFFHEFTRAMKETNIYKNDTYLSLYKLQKNKKADAFTKFINKELIPNILREHGLSVSHEYFRIDSTGWVTHHEEIEDTAKTVGLKPHLWDLVIAVEHENDPKDWNDEVIKLAHILCPLRVVIGYNGCNNRDEGDFSKLSFVAECLQRLQVSDSSYTNEILIILGNCKGSSKHDYNTFDYRGYIYDYEKGNFKRIT